MDRIVGNWKTGQWTVNVVLHSCQDTHLKTLLKAITLKKCPFSIHGDIKRVILTKPLEHQGSKEFGYKTGIGNTKKMK